METETCKTFHRMRLFSSLPDCTAHGKLHIECVLRVVYAVMVAAVSRRSDMMHSVQFTSEAMDEK
jgi:hypothetical protein